MVSLISQYLKDFSDNIGGDTNKSEFLTLSKEM